MGSCARRLSAMSTSEPISGPLALPARRVRVLVVDDDRDLRSALADLLRFEGLDADEAENGLEALLHLRTASPSPDVVLLDLAMPVMTGWEFRQAQLREPRLASIPVVILSSRSPEDLPVDAVLMKPCAPDRLVETLRRVAALAGAARK